MLALVLFYLALRLLKFCGVALLMGGTLAALLSADETTRKRAVHRFASPGLLATWLAGYLLSLELGVTLSQPWIVGALLLSLASQLALVHVAAHGTSRASALAVIVPLVATLALMVFRPTWSGPGR